MNFGCSEAGGKGTVFGSGDGGRDPLHRRNNKWRIPGKGAELPSNTICVVLEHTLGQGKITRGCLTMLLV